MESFLEPKTQLLVALSAAVAARCQHCFKTLYGVADSVGATAAEIRATVAIANKVGGKAQDFMTAFVAEATQGAVTLATSPAAGDGCGCS